MYECDSGRLRGIGGHRSQFEKEREKIERKMINYKCAIRDSQSFGLDWCHGSDVFVHLLGIPCWLDARDISIQYSQEEVLQAF